MNKGGLIDAVAPVPAAGGGEEGGRGRAEGMRTERAETGIVRIERRRSNAKLPKGRNCAAVSPGIFIFAPVEGRVTSLLPFIHCVTVRKLRKTYFDCFK